MSVRRLGCISVAGLLAVLVTLLLTTGFILLGGGSIFSPGPLNAQAGEEALRGVHSHAETGGRCEACHTAPWSSDTLADRCLDCHTSVAAELTDASTLHGALEVERSARGCRLCHTEHRGPTTALTEVDPATFPHAVTGYVLTGHRTQGAGQPFTCADCHPASLARFDATTCDTCHRQADATYMQAHTSAFGAECLVCHDGGDRYSRRTFDHGRAFPLTGKHTRAACAACHVGARSPADLKATPQTCVGCHAKDDQHKGAFGTACGACHKTDAWQGATFDHGKSAFPLTGKHIQVDCARCHINNVYKATPQTCVGCHAKTTSTKARSGRRAARVTRRMPGRARPSTTARARSRSPASTSRRAAPGATSTTSTKARRRPASAATKTLHIIWVSLGRRAPTATPPTVGILRSITGRIPFRSITVSPASVRAKRVTRPRSRCICAMAVMSTRRPGSPPSTGKRGSRISQTA